MRDSYSSQETFYIVHFVPQQGLCQKILKLIAGHLRKYEPFFRNGFQIFPKNTYEILGSNQRLKNKKYIESNLSIHGYCEQYLLFSTHYASLECLGRFWEC